MPKPPGTYLQSKKPDKIAADVKDAKALKLKVENAQRSAFEAALKRARLDPKKLDAMRKIAEACKDFGKEPSTKQGVLVKALGDVIDQLTEFAEAQAKFSELRNETAQPSKTFLNDAKPLHGSAPAAANVVASAFAVVAFVVMLKKAWAKVAGQ